MRGTVNRCVRPAIATMLFAATTVVMADTTAHAVGTFPKVPTRLYMIPKEHSSDIPDLLAGLFIPIETLKFEDAPVTGDVISGQSREIQVSAAEMASCNVVATTQPPFDQTGCTAIELDVGHGTLKFDPAPVAEDDPRFPSSDPRIQMYRFSNDVLLRDADVDEDLEGMTLALIGKSSGMNDVLKTMVYTPTVDDPMTEDDDEDYYYDGSNPETLTVILVPGDGSGSVTKFIDIKVLDYNNFPTVDVPEDEWMVPGGDDVELFTPNSDPSMSPTTPTLSVADEDNDEVIDQPQDGDDGDDDPGDGDDPDDGEGDEFLVAMWATCGKFSIVNSSGWSIFDDVEHAIDYVYDLVKDPSSDVALKEQLVAALESVLPDEVKNFPFVVPPVDPAFPTTGFVGVVNNIQDLNYSLGRVTFHAVDGTTGLPLGDATCNVRVLISDIGNNGLPAHYFGDPPSGLVVPMFGLDLFDTNYAPGVEQLTVQVDGGTNIDVALPTAVSVDEGSAVPAMATITPADHPPFQFTVSTAMGTGAVAGSDYTAHTIETVDVPMNASSVALPTPLDALVDPDIDPGETYLLQIDAASLVAPTGYTIGSSNATTTVTIIDPSEAPADRSVTISDVTAAEGDAGMTPFNFLVSLNGPAIGNETLTVSTAFGTADATDLTPLTAVPVTFAAGETSKVVPVQVGGDTTPESDETFTVTIGSPLNLQVADDTGDGVIQDDDSPNAPPQVVSIDPVSLTEGNSGTKAFSFVVTLDKPSPSNGRTVVATAVPGTASSPTDYLPLTTTLTFNTGEITKMATVLVNGDPMLEADETFTVQLSNPVGLTIGAGATSATGTIINDDSRRLMSITPPSLTEGDVGTKNFPFTLTLDGPAVGGESVVVNTTHLGTNNVDLMPLTAQVVTFAPGATTATVDVVVNGDTNAEPDEQFRLDVGTPTNLTIAPGATTATATILNDDLRRVVSIDDVTMAEGNSGTTLFTFTIGLDGPAIGTTTSVTAFNTHGTSDNTDLALTEIVVPFPQGATTATATFAVSGDTDVEGDDNFTVGVKNPVNATIDSGAGDGNGVIQNDDGAVVNPMLTINDVSMAEGTGGTTNFVFTLTLDTAAAGTESVSIATNHVTTDAADLTPAVPSPVPFATGSTTALVTVAVGADSTPEADETFTLSLSAPVGLLIADNLASGMILNDDAAPVAPVVSIADVTMAEGSGGGTTNFVFTLSLDKPALGTESVSIATNHVTTNAADLTPAPVSAAFAGGAMSTTVTVAVSADTTPEPNETFTLTLSAPVGLTIGDGSATGTIVNDDDVVIDPTIVDPAVTINDVSMTEGTGGTTNFVFTLSLDKPALGTESVSIATNHVTTNAADLTPAPVSAAFAGGAMSTTITVAVAADSTPEPNETFTLTLSTPVGVTISDGSATGTIVNDDVAPGGLSISDQGDITVGNDPGKAGANVPWVKPTATGGVPPVNVACSHQPGAFYPLGATTVTCTASDSAAATATDTFVVTVLDIEPPIIADNPDLTRVTSGPPVPVTFNLPAASDNSGVPPTVVCTPSSGTAFAIGVATVTCTATDGAGHQASSSFTIAVIPEDGTLPATGSDMRTTLVTATATTLLGAVLFLQRRRARPQT